MKGRLAIVEDRVTRAEVKLDGLREDIRELKADVRDVRTTQLTKWDVAQVVFAIVVGVTVPLALFGARLVASVTP